MALKWLRLSLLICLLITLSSSSFFLPSFLSGLITANHQTKAQLNYALKRNNIEALTFALTQESTYSARWLELAKKLANSDGGTAYQLGLYYQSQENYLEAIAWFQRAIRLNYSHAYIALAQHYFSTEAIDKAEKILAKLDKQQDIKVSTLAKTLEIKIAIERGNISFVEQEVHENFTLLQRSEHGRKLLDFIQQYQVLAHDKDQNFQSPSCANSIQLFATSINHLQHLEKLIIGVKAHPLSKSICFLPVRYIAKDTLPCTAIPSKAIQCDELHWQKLAKTINSRFVGVLLPEGGANVHLGILYLDAKDNLDVLIHEISHLLGFVDEYPLVKNHKKCHSIQQEPFALNIAVLNTIHHGKRSEVRKRVLRQLSWGERIKHSTPILQPLNKNQLHNNQQWKLGTPEEYINEVGVFSAQTCLNTNNKDREKNLNAFKPLSKATKMEYFSLDFPMEYLALIPEKASTFVMPSFHYNIALANYQLGNSKQANIWLKKSAEWESDDARKIKILQGSF